MACGFLMTIFNTIQGKYPYRLYIQTVLGFKELKGLNSGEDLMNYPKIKTLAPSPYPNPNSNYIDFCYPTSLLAG
jgi:hypothetical protein